MTEIITFVKTGNCPDGWEEATMFLDCIPLPTNTISESGDAGGVNTAYHYHNCSWYRGQLQGADPYPPGWSYSGTKRLGSTITLDPKHVKVRFCKKIYNNDLTYPALSIMMFFDDVPYGWNLLTAFEGYYPKGASSSLGSTQAEPATSHTHSRSAGSFTCGDYSYKYIGAVSQTGNTGSGSLTAGEQFKYVKVLFCQRGNQPR